MGNRRTKEQLALGLTRDELAELIKVTGFSEEKIRHYYASFLVDCPSGKLSRRQFQQMYRQLYPYSKSDKFCNRIFTIFDQNNDNKLDFYEFLRAIKITMNGDVKDKLRCAFDIYDLNGDGKIDKKEMKTVLNHIYDMLGEDTLKYRRHGRITDKKVDLIFEKFDLDRDECLSVDEFIEGCLKDEYLSQMLQTTLNMNTNGGGGTTSASASESSSSASSESSTATATAASSSSITSTISSSAAATSADTSVNLNQSNLHSTSDATTASSDDLNAKFSSSSFAITSAALEEPTIRSSSKEDVSGASLLKPILINRKYSSNQNLSRTASVAVRSSNKIQQQQQQQPQPPPRTHRHRQHGSSSFLNADINNYYVDSGYSHLKTLNRLKNVKESSNKRNNLLLMNKNSFGGSNSTGSPISSAHTSNSNLNASITNFNQQQQLPKLVGSATSAVIGAGGDDDLPLSSRFT